MSILKDFGLLCSICAAVFSVLQVNWSSMKACKPLYSNCVENIFSYNSSLPSLEVSVPLTVEDGSPVLDLWFLTSKEAFLLLNVVFIDIWSSSNGVFPGRLSIYVKRACLVNAASMLHLPSFLCTTRNGNDICNTSFMTCESVLGGMETVEWAKQKG